MMKNIIFTLLFLTVCFFQEMKSQSLDWLDDYNVVWESQSENASDSMPVGGGDTGLNVWVENNELLIYMQRSGVHDEYNGFPKLGRVRLWAEPNVFDGATSFKQELKLRESCIEITTQHPEHGELTFKIWTEVHRPKIHIECESTKAILWYSQYESWRTEPRTLSRGDEKATDRWGWWDTAGWDHDVVLEPDSFKQEKNSFTFWHVNPEEKLTSKLSYRLLGLEEHYGEFYDPLKDAVWGGKMEGDDLVFDREVKGTYRVTDFTGWRYKTSSPRKKQQLSFWLHNSHCGSPEKWLLELEKAKAENEISNQNAWDKNQKWWSEFWNRSFIVLNPEKGEEDPVWRVGRNYNLFRYMTALNAYGENPTMFNGGLLSVDPGFISGGSDWHPDWRQWSGGNYTLQNQRWVYWPMLKWGDFEHMENQFNFFERTLEVGKLRIKKHYGIEGWKIEEMGTVYGLPMPMAYGYEEYFGEKYKRQPWMEPGMVQNWCVIHHHTAMLEFSYMILEYYRYSGRDISKWLPIVKGAIDFFENYYRLKAKYNANFKEYDEEGKLIIFPASACESHYYVSNPVPDIAGLKAILKSTQRLPEKWINKFFVSKDELKRFENTIPDFYTEEYKGDIVMPPGKSVAYSWWKKTELYINYPMFPFNIIGMGDPEMETVHNTYKHWEKWQTRDSWKVVHSWNNANVAFARMGMTDKAAELTVKTLENGPFRFPSFWGPGNDWVPDHNWGGTGAVGLQEMLVQSLDDKIVLLPSWPENWDCDFKVHLPEYTVISGKVKNGKLESCEVVPAERQKDVIIPSLN